MKRIMIIILVALMATSASAADNDKNDKWYERLINHLITAGYVDKSVSVNRDNETHEITNATYDFRFTSVKLYESIKNAIIHNTHESEYYSESGTKNQKVYLLRLVDNGRRWSFKLEKVGKNNQFLVRVSTGDTFSQTIPTTDRRFNSIPWKSKTQTVTTPPSPDKKASIEALEEELRQAAAQRKQKLSR